MTEQRDEWGPWIEHDGKGCPIPRGFVVEILKPCGCTMVWVIDDDDHGLKSDWVAHEITFVCRKCKSHLMAGGQLITHYRIRRPRGLAILESCLTDLPAPEREGEPA